jgi:hypothetical protein
MSKIILIVLFVVVVLAPMALVFFGGAVALYNNLKSE